MNVKTTRFGPIEVDQQRIIVFPEGLLGFPENKKYVLLQTNDEGNFFWLQSAEIPELAFVVCDPLLFVPDYQVPVKPEEFSIIELNDLAIPRETIPAPAQTTDDGSNHATYGLLPCARRVLERGVTENQRVACFRLAIHLRITGLPIDLAISTLSAWAQKNRPNNGKGIIAKTEIIAQTQYAYEKDYRSYGCEEPTIAQHCDSACPIYAKIHRTQNS